MTPYDAVMIGLVLAGMVWGAIRGVTWQIASIASLVLGYLCSHAVSARLAPYLPGEPAVQRAGSMLAAYVVVSGGVFLVAWTVRATLRKMKFEAYDRHLGMLLGGAEGAILGLVGTMFVASLAPSTRGPIFASPTGHFVGRVMDAVGPVLPDEVRGVVLPFWAHLSDAQALPSSVADGPSASPAPSSEAPSVPDLVRQGRSRLGKAVGDAVKDEIERVGDNNDRDPPRR